MKIGVQVKNVDIMDKNKQYTKSWCYRDKRWRQQDPVLGVVCHSTCKDQYSNRDKIDAQIKISE